MKKYRGLCVVALAVLLTLPLFSCSVSDDEESGSVIRIVSVAPVEEALTADIIQDICKVAEDGSVTYEPGLTNQYVTVSLKNDSTPNTATGSQTNSYVTMTDYSVNFTGLNRSVSLPCIRIGGQSIGIEPAGTSSMTVLVFDLATINYIREHYPQIGEGESLTLRADIAIWGEDAFHMRVETTGSFTMVVDNFDRC